MTYALTGLVFVILIIAAVLKGPALTGIGGWRC